MVFLSLLSYAQAAPALMNPHDGGLFLAGVEEVSLFLSWSSFNYFGISLFQSWSNVQEMGQFVIVAGSGTPEDPYILEFLQVSQHSSQIQNASFLIYDATFLISKLSDFHIFTPLLRLWALALLRTPSSSDRHPSSH